MLKLRDPILSRVCAQPSRWTFQIPPIRALLERVQHAGGPVVDPFCGRSSFATHRNDLDPDSPCASHLDARDFLRGLAAQGVSASMVVLDPPYSPRQIAECYKAVGRAVTTEDTQNARFMREVRECVATIVAPGGVVVTCGWNSVGMGSAWPIEEILIVCHGGAHNDTIVVVQRKPENLWEPE